MNLKRPRVRIITIIMVDIVKKKVLQKLLWLLPVVWGGLLVVFFVWLPAARLADWEARLGAGRWEDQRVVLGEVVRESDGGEAIEEMIGVYLGASDDDDFLKAMLFLQANGLGDVEIYRKQFEWRLWPMAFSEILKSDTGGRFDLWSLYGGIEGEILKALRDGTTHDVAFEYLALYLKKGGRWSYAVVGDVIWRRGLMLGLEGDEAGRMDVARRLGEIISTDLIAGYDEVIKKVLVDKDETVRLRGLMSVLDLLAKYGFDSTLVDGLDLCAADEVEEIRAVAELARRMMVLKSVKAEGGDGERVGMRELLAWCGDERGEVRNVGCVLILRQLGGDKAEIVRIAKGLLVSLDDRERASGLMIAGLSGVRPMGRKKEGGAEVDLIGYLGSYVPWEMKQRVRLAEWMQGRDDAFGGQIPQLVSQGKIDLGTLVLGATHLRRYGLLEGLWRGEKMVDPRMLELLGMRYRGEVFGVDDGVVMPVFEAGLTGKEKQRSRIEIAVWLRLGLYRLAD